MISADDPERRNEWMMSVEWGGSGLADMSKVDPFDIIATNQGIT